jgi:hypothetical protein
MNITGGAWRRMTVPIALLALAACAAPGTTPEPSVTREPFETVAPTDRASGDPSIADAPAPIPDAVWSAILDDLEDRLGEPVTAPTVVEARAVTWNDGSLGCPRPGEVYTQALVEGFQVILEVDGERWDYRAGMGTDVRLCEGAIEGG